ncbi:MAG: hypothetical protein M3Y18_07375 [Candidatus Eremiobacteraeota bacterium]|nr:hypothetical protein [Candidatus Eremiobacteraeota bacterium]
MKQTLALLGALLLASCSSGSNNPGGGSPSPAPSLANPIPFALYPNARVLASRDVEQVVTAGQAGGVLSRGAGSYAGKEVIAASGATFAQLQGWVTSLNARPPAGYVRATDTSLDRASGPASSVGLGFALFAPAKTSGNPRALLLIVLDPPRFTKRLGPVLHYLSSYRSLPSFMRAKIDEQSQSLTGFTISEATQADSPIGAALGALDSLQRTNARGIILIDATKR